MGCETIAELMERASAALVATRYLECERWCLEALSAAREAGDYETCGRIVMPLQEARRQRRQIAVEAGVTVAPPPRVEADRLVEQVGRGCVLLLPPAYGEADEQAVREAARRGERMIEPLYLDGEALRQAFEQQMERRGDAALAAIDAAAPAAAQVEALAAVLERVGDHELAHQRLAQAARQAARAHAPAGP